MKPIEIVYRYEALDAPARPRPADGDAALLRLKEGNRTFAALLAGIERKSDSARQVIQVDPRDLGLLPGDKAPRQRPFAAVLGCSDARVPVELIFNEGPNDLFVIRVAGNGLGMEVLGSLKYAVEHLGGSLKLVVVLGHSGCGAVSAAVDAFLNPRDYLPLATRPSLRQILDRLLVVVHVSARKLATSFGSDVVQNPGYRQALIETSIVTNAALAAYSIQQEIGEREPGALQVAFGVYLLEAREVWTPPIGASKDTGLAAAPRDLAEFVELGDAIMRSMRITSFLAEEESTPTTT